MLKKKKEKKRKKKNRTAIPNSRGYGMQGRKLSLSDKVQQLMANHEPKIPIRQLVQHVQQ
jgi:hypothetical protein